MSKSNPEACCVAVAMCLVFLPGSAPSPPREETKEASIHTELSANGLVLTAAKVPKQTVVIERAPAPSGKCATRTARIAGIVLKWIRGDKEANMARLEPLVREAARQGARIVVTTECFLDGYAIQDKSIPLEQYRALGEPIPEGRYLQRLRALAKELEIHLVAGFLEADGELRYNTAVLIGPAGELIGKYRKHTLEHELVRNTPGQDIAVMPTPFGRMGLMICADRRDPDLVKRICAAGADFLICPSGGMFGPEKNDHILQQRSAENRIPIVFVHPAEFLVTGSKGEILARELVGDKLLIAPGEIGSPASDQNKVLCFDLPAARIR